MQIFRAENYEDLSRRAANIISAQVILKPNCVLGLATGSSPEGAYKQLIKWHRRGDLDFSLASTFNLDEYLGLGPDHPQSYARYMEHNLFSHINIGSGNTHIPDGLTQNIELECARYDAAIRRKGGIDLQVLGLGTNGHIGFNEPGAAFEKDTFCVDLTESTIAANSRFFGAEEAVPRRAITMGIRSIMQARKILVVAYGAHKAEIARAAFCGPVTPLVPASVLQLHNDVVLAGDEAALSLI